MQSINMVYNIRKQTLELEQNFKKFNDSANPRKCRYGQRTLHKFKLSCLSSSKWRWNLSCDWYHLNRRHQTVCIRFLSIAYCMATAPANQPGRQYKHSLPPKVPACPVDNFSGIALKLIHRKRASPALCGNTIRPERMLVLLKIL